MSQIKQLFTLAEQGYGNKPISRITGESRNTVKHYFKKAQQLGLDVPRILGMSDPELEALLSTPSLMQRDNYRGFMERAPEYVKQLSAHKHLSRLVLWEEERKNGGTLGYGYSFIDNESWKVSVSEVVMPELYLPDSIASGRTLSLRLSTRFKVKYSGKVNFESVSFFQPAVWSSQHVALSENINFRSINSFDIPVTAKISIGVQALLQVSTLPHYLDNSIRKSDTRISMVFKSEF